jgi:hypothetical protein
MIKQVRHSYFNTLERDTPSETGFIQSVDALTRALKEEWQVRVLKLKEIYSISQTVELYTDIAYFANSQYNTTKDKNEYKSDVNPF